jgi:hypothetical protein
LSEGDVSSQYCVLRCPQCHHVFRHDIKLGAFGGKPIKNRMCQVCGGMVCLEKCHLDHDPLIGRFNAEFKRGDELGR